MSKDRYPPQLALLWKFNQIHTRDRYPNTFFFFWISTDTLTHWTCKPQICVFHILPLACSSKESFSSIFWAKHFEIHKPCVCVCSLEREREIFLNNFVQYFAILELTENQFGNYIASPCIHIDGTNHPIIKC